MRVTARSTLIGAFGIFAALSVAAFTRSFQGSGLPLKYAGPPTVPDVTAGDLMTRLYIFSDDSMLGRQFGEIGSARATAYIEREVKALGLAPGGENGTFIQQVPSRNRDIRGTAIRDHNVIAIVPGTDDKLKGEYVAITAHSDGLGIKPAPWVDHDSAHAFNSLARRMGAATSDNSLRVTPQLWDRIRALTEAARAAHGGPRIDSVYNGADFDGSGCVALIEIAEALANGNLKPKRSILFIWHTGSQLSQTGAFYFVDHPTVPRDSIVAVLNADGIGRGGVSDMTGQSADNFGLSGGPGYLQLVGTRRISKELGDLIEAANTEQRLDLRFDYRLDDPQHQRQLYVNGDHYAYARKNIPVALFTTGSHADFEWFTDEAQYVDYDRLETVTKLIMGAALRVANLDHRLKLGTK